MVVLVVVAVETDEAEVEEAVEEREEADGMVMEGKKDL